MIQEQKKPLIVLTGPTAVGKTDTSLALANAIGGEIVSADSIQIYRYMDIGSAKIKEHEKQGIPHYLIDALNPDEEFNVVIFQKLALKAIEEIYSHGHIPIITGGTGFYIQSILYGIDFDETQTDDRYRQELEQFAVKQGTQALHDRLRKVDKESAEAIHPNNVKRVIRALEYYKQTGQKISDHNEEQRKKASPYQFAYFVLERSRSQLYERINRRVDQMFEQGLLDEVRNLLTMGYSRDLVSMQGLGYKETAAYLDGEMTLEEARETIKRDTRHFAKRQLTWFRRETETDWINMENYQENGQVLEVLLARLREKNILPERNKENDRCI